MKINPVMRGVISASLAPALALSTWIILDRGRFLTLGDLQAIAYLFVLILVLSAAITIVFGLPYVLLLRSHGLANALTVILGAAVIGAASFILLFLVITDFQGKPEWEAALMGGGLGLAAGIGFWFGAFHSKQIRNTR